ncbi:DUF7192 family protein [Fontivita pretiosa]|uniref:DUF7192 family protein n=1 Tax=Fontivita pretiosa TaxID=2989684 RepID=UPI003D1772C7
MRSRLIAARFAGKCRVCGKPVAKGEQVYFAKYYGVRCAGCGPHTADDPPLPSKRGKKSRRFAPPPFSKREPDVTDPKDRAAQLCTDGIHRYEFYSVKDAVEDALCDYAQNDTNRERVRAAQNHALSGSDRWGNYFTRERFLGELHNPGEDLLKAVDQMRQQLIGSLDLPTTPRRKVRRGLDWGDELDADRWLVREPNAWERSIREQQPRRTITIGCNITVSASVRPEQLLYRGAAALALADILAQRGCNVGIVLFKSVREPTSVVDWGLIRYEVKSALMPLDISAVAFAMCEIAFSRIVGVCGEARHWPGVLRSGFGCPAPVPAADRENIEYLIDADCLSRDAAVAWLKGQLERED